MRKLFKLSILAVTGSLVTLVGCNGKDGMMMQKNGQKPMPKDQMNRQQMQQGQMDDDSTMEGGGCSTMGDDDSSMTQQPKKGRSRYSNN